MRTTAARSTVGSSGAPTGPATPGRALFRTVLARELAATFLLLGVALAAGPARTGATPGSAPWGYQREAVDVAGRGPINAYARATIRATAWLARASIERQRDVGRLNLLQYLAGDPAARAVGAWRPGHRLALEGGTAAALLALVACGVLLRPATRSWAVAILLLLAMTLLVTKPETSMRLAGAPSTAIPAGAARVVASLGPAGEPALARGPDAARQALTARYWSAFVASPLSRMQTGGGMLADAAPGDKPGVLADVRRHLPGVDAWASGRHALGRAVVATAAMAYLLPFALVLGILAMVAACAQALCLLLVLGGLVALPLALDPRLRAAVARWWLAPLAGAALLLGLASLLSLSVMWGAAALHTADEAVGVLLTGSAVPAVAVALLAWRLRRGQPGPARGGGAP